MSETTNSVANIEEENKQKTNAAENTAAETLNEATDKTAEDPYKTITVVDMQDEETAKENDLGEQY